MAASSGAFLSRFGKACSAANPISNGVKSLSFKRLHDRPDDYEDAPPAPLMLEHLRSPLSRRSPHDCLLFNMCELSLLCRPSDRLRIDAICGLSLLRNLETAEIAEM
jgi:hypothetical protein